MHRFSGLVLLAAVLGLTAAAADNKIVTTYRDAGRGATRFTKIAVAVLTPDADLRRRAEGGLARRIKNSVAVSTVVPDAEIGDRDAVKRRLTAEGFDGAVLVRQVSVETTADIQQGEQISITYASMWDYWGQTIALPGYANVEKVVNVEVAVYSVADAKLVWSGRMTSRDPKSLRTFLDDLVEVAGGELRKQKLV